MRMSAMKAIDRYAGFVLAGALLPLKWLLKRKNSPKPIRKALIIKFWGMGSIIMSSYLFSALKKALPDAEIHLLTLSSNEEIARLLGIGDGLKTMRLGQGFIGLIREIFRMISDVSRSDYDLVLDLEYLTRFTALVTLFSKAPVSVGFYARGFFRGNFHTERVPFNPYLHVKDNFFNQLKAAGIKTEPEKYLPIQLDPEVVERAKQFLSASNIDPENFVIINPNAGETALERRWPPDCFARLIRRLENDVGITSVLIGSPDEKAYCENLAGMLDGDEAPINIAGKTDLELLAGVIKLARVVITNDTGPLHLASHLDVPTVSLFGPETPVLWGPLGDKARTFYKNIDCSPCLNVHNMKTANCLKSSGAECLSSITADEVFEAALEALGRP